MKKILFVMVIALFAVSLVFANNQTIYSVSDSIYSEIKALYIATGLSLPSTSGPYSGAELMAMMDKVQTSKLSEGLLTTYEKVNERLKADSQQDVFNWKGEIAGESYLHTNNEDFLLRSSWIRGWNDMKPFAKFYTDA